MIDAPRIPRKTSTPEEGSFAALRAEAIRLLGQHSGEVWTDYNLHDPGITILEQLCYGLTDLIYRTGFDVADHLTGPDGTIEFERQALHLPMYILPSRPTTAADFRRRLLDEIEEIEDAWILPRSEETQDREGLHGEQGLYVVVLRAIAQASGREPAEREAGREELRAAALKVFLENRNLCEDIYGPPIVAEEVLYRLVADLEMSGPRPPGEILEEVYNTVEAHVAGRPTPDSAIRRLTAGETLDELLTGPTGLAGLSMDKNREYNADYIFMPDVVARVQAVRGVAAVRDLALKPVDRATPGGTAAGDTEGSLRAQLVDAVPRIVKVAGAGGTTRWMVPVLDEPPTGDDPDRVRLWKDGRPVAEPADFPARYRESSVKRRRRSRPYERFESFYSEPVGEYRDLAEYHSIQEHFPSIYGVGSRGLPASATPRERSSARQLKAYLLVLEQVMANYAVNLHSVSSLFSSDNRLGPTYRYQSLDEEAIPGFREVYPGPTGHTGILVGPGGPYVRHPDAHLTAVRREFDDHLERRGRLYDQMLAMFGERHTQSSLRRFGRPDGGPDVDAWVVENKARYLEEIVRVTRDRVGAFDYSDGSPEDSSAPENPDTLRARSSASGFALRIGLLLGIEDPRPHALATGTEEDGGTEGFHVVEHLLLRPIDGERAHRMAGRRTGADAPQVDPDQLWSDFYPLRMTVVFPAWVGRFQSPGFRVLANETVGINCPAHVSASCLWLDRPSMQRFEGLLGRFENLYGDWLGKQLTRQSVERGDEPARDERAGANATDLDAAKHALIGFLVEARRRQETEERSEGTDGA